MQKILKTSLLLAGLILGLKVGAKGNERGALPTGSVTFKGSYAVLMQEDDQGKVEALCAVDMAIHPEVSPPGMAVNLDQDSQVFTVPYCSSAQIQFILKMVGRLSDRFEGIGVAVALSNVRRNPLFEPLAPTFALGSIYPKAAPRQAGGGIVSFSCAPGGRYLGYYLVPSFHR